MTEPNEQLSQLPELTPFAQEIFTRYLALSITDRKASLAIMMRLTVEVHREFLEHYPEGVEEFLRLCAVQPGRVN